MDGEQTTDPRRKPDREEAIAAGVQAYYDLKPPLRYDPRRLVCAIIHAYEKVLNRGE